MDKTEPIRRERKERGENFSQDEVMLLLKELEPHKDILDSKMCSGNVIIHKNKIWGQVSEEHSVRAGIFRTEAQLRGLYHRLKKFARKEYLMVKETGNLSIMKPASLLLFRMNPNDIRPINSDQSDQELIEKLLAESEKARPVMTVKQEYEVLDNFNSLQEELPVDGAAAENDTFDVQHEGLGLAASHRDKLASETVASVHNGTGHSIGSVGKSFLNQVLEKDVKITSMHSVSPSNNSSIIDSLLERATARAQLLEESNDSLPSYNSGNEKTNKRKANEVKNNSFSLPEPAAKLPNLTQGAGKPKRNDLQSQLMTFAQEEHDLKMKALREKLEYRRLKRHCAELRLMQLKKEFDGVDE